MIAIVSNAFAMPFTTPAPTSTPLAGAFSVMSSNSWATFSMNNLTAALLDTGGGTSVLAYLAKGIYDAVHKQIRIWGHGHAQNQKLVDYDEVTNTWSINASNNGTNGGFLHGYSHLTVNPTTGDLYLKGTSNNVIQRLPWGSTTWSTIAAQTSTQFPSTVFSYGCEWFPALNGGAGGLVISYGDKIEYSNAALTSFTTAVSRPGNPLLMGNYQTVSACTDGFAYSGGGVSTPTERLWSISPTGVAVQLVTPCPIHMEVAGGPVTTGGKLRPHPNGTDLLIFGSAATYRYNAGAGTFTNLGQPYDNHYVSAAITVPAYGGVVFIEADGESGTPRCRLYKA